MISLSNVSEIRHIESEPLLRDGLYEEAPATPPRRHLPRLQALSALIEVTDAAIKYRTTILGGVSIVTGGILLTTAGTPVAAVGGAVGMGASAVSVGSDMAGYHYEAQLAKVQEQMRVLDAVIETVVQDDPSVEIMQPLMLQKAFLSQERSRLQENIAMSVMLGRGASMVGLCNLINAADTLPRTVLSAVDAVTVVDATLTLQGATRDLTGMFAQRE